MVHVYCIGAKGIGFYGGFESFIQKLLEYHRDRTEIKYHIACKANGEGCMDISKLEGVSEVVDNRFTYCNASCFLVTVPEWMRSAQAVVYDIKALQECCRHIKENQIKNAIVYIMACRIGPFMQKFVKKLHKYGAKIYLNPDGHEWKRAKWPAPVRRYWKESERLMVKYADKIICDSINIEKYIQKEYGRYHPKTIYIAYGAETQKSSLADDDPKYINWINEHELFSGFYIMVGRCVPENNYETVIREFMKSGSARDLVIISTDNPKLMKKIDERLHYKKDKRIKFVGTVYDRELLTKIRENAYGYFHGHSVGGTNPSLLEALGATKVNLLFDIGFNREVAEDSAFYWSTEEGDLADLIRQVEMMSEDEKNLLGNKAKKRIVDVYSWQLIADEYGIAFTKD